MQRQQARSGVLTVLRGVQAAGGALRDLLYPPACAVCRAEMGGHGAVCVACWSRIRFIERPYCEVLGTPFSHDLGAGILSAQAIADPPVFDRLRSAALHDDVARDLVHALKYRDRVDLAPMMATWMVRAGAEALSTCDGILAVPLHRRRLFARQYNQAAELARHIGRIADRPFLARALERRKKTRQQVGLSANARTENVRGAFAVGSGREAEIFGRRLVLVDDVYTTGATVSAATRALKRAGAAEVTVLTFARALHAPI